MDHIQPQSPFPRQAHRRPFLSDRLVYRHVGRMKDIKDATAGKGTTYYQSLLNSKTQVSSAAMAPQLVLSRSFLCPLHSSLQSRSEKQIQLDLFRTLPNNKHFKSGGSGVGQRCHEYNYTFVN